jgi:ABC-type spermidine/putrescine transport system permease subunit II
LLSGTLALHEPVLGLFLCPPGGETLAALAWPTLRSSLTPVVAAVATLTLFMGLGVAGAVVWLWGLERRRGRGPDGRVAGD